MRNIDEIKASLRAAFPTKHIEEYSEEGQDGASRYLHSLCGHEGNTFDDREHICYGQMYGASREEASARAHFVAGVLDSLPGILDELALLRSIAENGEKLMANKQITCAARPYHGPLGGPGLIPCRTAAQDAFEEGLKNWATYWKPKS